MSNLLVFFLQLDGMTVLMLAVLKGNLEITNLLIDRKCNIDAKTVSPNVDTICSDYIFSQGSTKNHVH